MGCALSLAAICARGCNGAWAGVGHRSQGYIINKEVVAVSTDPQPEPEEILGDWDLLLVSDAALSPPILRFRFSEGDAASSRSTVSAAAGKAGKTGLKAEFIQGGKLSLAGKSVSFGEGALLSLDLPAQAAQNAIRLVNRDLLVGLVSLVDVLGQPGHQFFQALQDFREFIMPGPGQAGRKEKSELSLPCLLRRISTKNEARQ